MKIKILVTYQIPKKGLQELSDFDIIYPTKEQWSKTEIIEKIKDCEVLLPAFTQTIDKEIIEAGEKLKIIANFGVGFNNIDLDFATQQGIVVTNTPNAVCEPTAEMAMGLMLSLMRKITWCDQNLKQNKDFEWGIMKNLGSSLYAKTLGIIGMGKIGKSLAQKADVFGMKIIYHNRKPMSAELEKQYKANYVSKQELLEKSDVVSLNCPLTKETEHLLSENEFKSMKKGAFLINTARGQIVDEKALSKYLKNAHLGGAGLDVFENEPSIYPELLKLNNVVLTPHIGTGTIDTRIAIAQEAAKNIIGFFQGKKDITCVNKI